MPPKDGEKKSKKKEERERREAEDARVRAEEELRLVEVKAKKDREVRDQREKEALEQIFKQEGHRLQEEEEEVRNINDQREIQLSVLEEEREMDVEWAHHLTCSRLPNVKIEKDVNSFLSLLLQENLIIEGSPSIKPFLDLLPSVQQLSADLEEQMSVSIDRQNFIEFERLKGHLFSLTEITDDKCDVLTADILQQVDLLAREANENFQLTATGSDYSVGLWGNVTKNPRFKIIDFPDQNMSASLPKPLALSNVAMRLLFETNSKSSTIYEEAHLESKLHMRLIGGVLLLDLVEFPDLPKVVDTWTIRQSEITTV